MPTVKYDSDDQSGGSTSGVQGSSCSCDCRGTGLDRDDTCIYSVGVNVTIPLQPREDPISEPLK